MVSRLSPLAAQNVDGCIIDRLVFSLLQGGGGGSRQIQFYCLHVSLLAYVVILNIYDDDIGE